MKAATSRKDWGFCGCSGGRSRHRGLLRSSVMSSMGILYGFWPFALSEKAQAAIEFELFSDLYLINPGQPCPASALWAAEAGGFRYPSCARTRQPAAHADAAPRLAPKCSGAEAPAVMPTRWRCSNHSGWSWLASSTRRPGAQLGGGIRAGGCCCCWWAAHHVMTTSARR